MRNWMTSLPRLFLKISKEKSLIKKSRNAIEFWRELVATFEVTGWMNFQGAHF